MLAVHRKAVIVPAIVVATSVFGPASCQPAAQLETHVSDSDRTAAREVVDTYVRGWLEDDRDAVLSTLADDAILMPAGMARIEGKPDITRFWWPDDGSTTTVTRYVETIDEIDGSGRFVFVRAHAELDFVYEKDGDRSEVSSRNQSITILRRNDGGRWVIARRIWGPAPPA